MKVAIIRKKYTFHGGAEVFSKGFIENLAAKGNEIHVFAMKWQSNSTHKNIYFHKVPAVSFNSFLRDLSFAVSTFFMLKRKREFYDIIQTHDRTLFQDVYRAVDGCHIEWLKQRLRRAGIATKLSVVLNPFHWLILAIEHIIFKCHRFKKILALSEMVKKNIMDNYNVPSRDIEVVYNGVDLKKYHPDNRTRYRKEIRNKYGLTDDEFVVLFVGSGFERKGVKYLIKAVETVSGPVSLLIVGRGPQNRFRHMIKKQNIIFCGPRQKVHKYYAAADIFVFPTLYEPFGNVHLEALASGLPVITTKNSGASEIITDGRQGFIVEKPEDTQKIAEKISLLMDRNVLDRTRIEARELAEAFTFDRHIEMILNLYDSIRHCK